MKPRPEVAVYLESEVLLPIPREEWVASDPDVRRERVWLSKHFMVQQFAPARGFVRLSVSRPEVGEDGSWKAEISWEELMRCKREIGCADRDAVEILPRDRDVVDVSNMRHIWLLPLTGPDPLPFIWRRPTARRGSSPARRRQG